MSLKQAVRQAMNINPDRRPATQLRQSLPMMGCLMLGLGGAFLPATAQSQQYGYGLDEILVIGEGIGSLRLNEENEAGSRLGLSAFEIPASVDIITREEINSRGDYDALMAVTRSTGISSSASPGNGGTSVSARGFNGHTSVTNTYDGTRLYLVAGTVTFPTDTWTIERVEVLRGAGSVIQGIGAIGATVNYVPKTPQFGESDFEALLAAGSFGFKRLALGGGAELSEDWAFRLDGVYQDRDSNVERFSEQRKVLAGSLLYQPVEEFSMRLSIDYAQVDQDSPYFGTPLIDGQADRQHRKQNFNFADAFLEYEDVWTRLHTRWQLSPNVTFRNDTYLIDSERQWQNLEMFAYNPGSGLIDRDGFSYYGIIHDVQQVGTRGDFLIESDWGGMSNKFSIGADINSIDLDYHNNWSEGMFYAGNSVPVTGWTPDTLADANIPTVLAYTTDTTQSGIFFDNVLQMTQAWSLVLGGRYDKIDYKRRDYALGGGTGSAFDTDYSEFTWRGGVVYQALDTLSFYAQYSKATDPVTSPASMSAGFSDWDLTRGRQYEVGVKQEILEGRGEYTLAYFDIAKTNLITTPPGSMVSEQVGRQSSNGVELTFRVSPLDTVSLDMNATWLNAEFDEFHSGGVSLAGNTPRNVPDKTANFWLNWSPREEVILGAGLRYVDSRYINDTNTLSLPSYTVIDASASWDVTDTTRVSLRGRNLNNERDYVLSAYGSNQWLFAEPRSFELSVRYSL